MGCSPLNKLIVPIYKRAFLMFILATMIIQNFHFLQANASRVALICLSLSLSLSPWHFWNCIYLLSVQSLIRNHLSSRGSRDDDAKRQVWAVGKTNARRAWGQLEWEEEEEDDEEEEEEEGRKKYNFNTSREASSSDVKHLD
jgi:hypothetical protein